MDIIEVVWYDTCTEEADIPLKRALELSPLERRNVGYSLYSDKEKIIIGFGIIDNLYNGLNAYQYTTTIDRGAIKEIKVVNNDK